MLNKISNSNTPPQLLASFSCRFCNSDHISFFKRIHQGKIQQQFHYGICCLDCHKSYKVERTKEIYEKVKDLQWEYSKHAKKLNFRGGVRQTSHIPPDKQLPFPVDGGSLKTR